VAVAFFLACFLWFGGDGLRTDFTHDDLMNGWRGWFRSWKDHLLDIVLFWRPVPGYRPLGNILYKVFFSLSGLNLFWMRVFLTGLLLAGTFLAYSLARRLAGSREAAALTALLLVHHSGFSHFYYNTGTCYDILSYFFYLASLLLYVRIRQAGRFPRVHEIGAIGGLLILALDSKEMAVTLPLAIGFYEILYHRPARIASRELGHWLACAAIVPVICGVLVAAFVFGRVLSAEGLGQVSGYTMTISPAEYLKQTSNYLNDLFYSRGWFNPAKTAIFLLVLLGMALRSRRLLYGWLLFNTGILPMAFIPPRSLTAIIIPLVGLMMYAAILLVSARDGVLAIWRFWRKPGSAPESPPLFGLYGRKQFALFAALALLLWRTHAQYPITLENWRPEQTQIRGVIEQWRQLHPSLRKGGRVLIVKDPFGKFEWASIFIGRLLYNDDTLTIDRLGMLKEEPDAQALRQYDQILTYEEGRLRDVLPSELWGKSPDLPAL